MNPKKYRKKPEVVEAIQWTGDNLNDVLAFADRVVQSLCLPVPPYSSGAIEIKVVEGVMLAWKGDYIIKVAHDKFKIRKPDIFKEAYEEMEGE